jgi:hypothetical protein
LGDLHFHYAIAPLAEVPDRAEMFNAAALLAAGLQVSQLRAADQHNLSDSLARSLRTPQPLPVECGFVALHGGIVLTSLRRTAAGLEVRVFNPNNEPVQGEFDLSTWPAVAPRPARAVWVNLESIPQGPSFDLPGKRFAFDMRGKEIKTICLTD